MLSQGIGLTPDRYFIVLLAGAFLIRHSKHFIHDFAPFILILIAYDFLRGFASSINTGVNYDVPIAITKFMFNGHIPTSDLQQKFYTAGYLHWYDYSSALLYSLHFVIPLSFAFFLWFNNRKRFREFMLGISLLSYVALIFYVLFPVAPPWLAAESGRIPPITRILHVVLANYPETIHLPSIYHSIGTNLVAALPSMHAGFVFIVLLFAIKFFKGRGAVLAIPYVIAMCLTIVYLGEHYLVDIILGAALAFLCFLLAGVVVDKYAKQLEIF